MTGTEYSRFTATTNRYPEEHMLACLVFGLVSEAGEVADKVKKAYRDNNGVFSNEDVLKELGDVCWYVSEIAGFIGHNMDSVMAHNLEKLSSRAARGVIHGSGDNR